MTKWTYFVALWALAMLLTPGGIVGTACIADWLEARAKRGNVVAKTLFWPLGLIMDRAERSGRWPIVALGFLGGAILLWWPAWLVAIAHDFL